jgi:hypothetical protein
MDLVAVHAAPAQRDDLGLEAFRLVPLPPFGAAAARQKIALRSALQVPIVILAEGLRAGAVVAIKVANPLERLRSARFDRLVLRDQKPPFLQIIAFDRPVVAVVAHRIAPLG